MCPPFYSTVENWIFVGFFLRNFPPEEGMNYGWFSELLLWKMESWLRYDIFIHGQHLQEVEVTSQNSTIDDLEKHFDACDFGLAWIIF